MAKFVRRLGKSGMQVSALGMGCWAIGGPFWKGETPVGYAGMDDMEAIRAIHCAMHGGISFFDTADVYGAGHSERILAKALAGRRDKVIIATKFGNTFDEATRRMRGEAADPGYIEKALQASLKRLNTDYIDLYQIHIWSMPKELAVPAIDKLEELVARGQIRAYGWSTDDHSCVDLIAPRPNCTAIQNALNIFFYDKELLVKCEKYDLASVNRSPLAMGLLSGKYTADSVLPDEDVRGKKKPDWLTYFKDGRPNQEFLGKIEAVKDILQAGGRTLAQGALGWIWGVSDLTIPIPGIRNQEQARENAGALDFGPLTSEQLNEINKLLGHE